ncbi:transcriptional regulator [Embleya sp. NPDC050154]|uniref:transcriptional regulator n=1 Tax=Embleya sp. NPDC050154 TaxID=3363988 RepID=UPI0037A166B3
MRKTTERTPNARLRERARARGWSPAASELCTHLDERARSLGLNVVFDERTVRRWLSGDSRWPQRVHRVALEEIFGLPCTHLGFAAPADPPGPAPADTRWEADTVVTDVLETSRSDLMTDHHLEPARQGPLLTGRELLESVRPWLDPTPGERPAPPRPGRVGMSDVASIRATTEAFRTWDNAHGGGLSRHAVVAQLMSTAALLQIDHRDTRVERALFSAVADLASVAGWMTHDVGRHAESQQYFMLGLRAASHARDAAIGAHLLNCMARQASHLDRVDDALELVQLAQYGTRRLPDGRLRAVLSALQARCLAITGDLRGFDRAAGSVVDSLAAAGDDDPPFVQWFDEAEYGVTIGVCHLIAAGHDRSHAPRAVELITTASATRPGTRVRSRAFDQVALARANVAAADLEGADQATERALVLMGDVDSARVRDRLAELDIELTHTPSPTARHTRDRIAEALTPH